ncbi:hypothetical protein ABTL18_20320, partial [Acinetobacter baumannii]
IFLLIGWCLALGIQTYAQSSTAKSAKKTEKEEKPEKSAKASSNEKETAEERDERKKEDMRRFGRAQADFWKGEHERHVAKKEA